MRQRYSLAGTFSGVLNISLRAFGAQLGLDSVNLMLFHFLLSTFYFLLSTLLSTFYFLSEDEPLYYVFSNDNNFGRGRGAGQE